MAAGASCCAHRIVTAADFDNMPPVCDWKDALVSAVNEAARENFADVRLHTVLHAAQSNEPTNLLLNTESQSIEVPYIFLSTSVSHSKLQAHPPTLTVKPTNTILSHGRVCQRRFRTELTSSTYSLATRRSDGVRGTRDIPFALRSTNLSASP